MNMQDYLSTMVKAGRADRMANSDQLTLGELILKLEPIVSGLKPEKTEPTVRYDFEYLFPTEFNSWRGSYAELSLNFETKGEEMKVSDFLKMCKETVGKEFTGYKGGEFKMSKHTPIWIANYGNSGSTALIEVVHDDYLVILITGYTEY